ncbi:MAG: hypothetical protein ACR2O0_04685, partial [Rhizobiaceae bacterium]
MQPTRFPLRDSIAGRMSGFIAHLRQNGVVAGPPETGLALEALGQVNTVNSQEVRMALKAVCASDFDQRSRFDELFDAYWLNKGLVRQRYQSLEEKLRPQPLHTSHLAAQEGVSDGSGKADTPEDNE